MLRQLVYVSACKCGDARQEAERILKTSRRNNEAAGVTGLLAYADRAFIQVLEGPAEIVGATMARIEQDPRHSLTAVVSDEIVATRSFGAWSMAWRDLPADDPIAKQVQSVSSEQEIDHAHDVLVETILTSFLEGDAA